MNLIEFILSLLGIESADDRESTDNSQSTVFD